MPNVTVDDGAVIHRAVEFNIFSKALSADQDAILKELGMSEPDGKKRLKTTASSNIKDLSGDEMTTKALEIMRASAEENMTIFLNHKYTVPDDVFGSVEKASLVDKGDFVDLDLIIRVNDSNPRAVQAHESIEKDGVKLGCSIGALIPEGGATRQKGGGLKIDEVRLLEASIVGIPANPRSFVQYATKALMKAQLDDAPEDEIESSGPPKPATKAEDGALQSGLPMTVGENGVEKATTWVKTKPDGSADIVVEGDPPADAPADAGKGKKGLEDVVDEVKGVDHPLPEGKVGETEPESITKEAAAPSEGENGEPDTGDEPEATEAAQDAPVDESTPENDGAADLAAVEEQVETAKALGPDALAGLLKNVTHKWGETIEALRVQKELTEAAETRAQGAEADVLLAKEIIETIASLPLGRRTAFKAGISEFRTKLSGVYNDDVIDLIERGTN